MLLSRSRSETDTISELSLSAHRVTGIRMRAILGRG
jgi:hypothetical protein